MSACARRIACHPWTNGTYAEGREHGEPCTGRWRHNDRTGRVPVAEARPPTEPARAAEPGDDGILWQRPSPRLLLARRIQAGLVTAPVAIVGGLVAGGGGAAGGGL